MPTLIVKKKAEIIKELVLKNTESSYSIGSDKLNDLVIDDKLVSMNHARVEHQNNRFFIYDLKSAFGTYLNAQRVDEFAELRNGDFLQIGKYTIIFDNPLEDLELDFISTQASEQINMHSKQGGGEKEKPVTSEKAQTKFEALEKVVRKDFLAIRRHGNSEFNEMAPYYLLAIYGPYTGKRYQLRYGEIKIGRDDNLNDIVLCKNGVGKLDQSISRRHATIIYKDNSFFVVDKRSKTRTHVNNETVPIDGEIELFPNDEIEIVSDQQSTIFRFVEADTNDCRPPRKAGVWWVRYQSKFMTALSATALIAGVYLLTTGFLEHSMIRQKPEPLSFDLSTWIADKSMTIESFDLDNLDLEKTFQSLPAVSDFNRDGYVDIATTNITDKPILIDGQTRLPKWIIDTMPADPSSIFVAADINQDNFNDLIYLSSDGRLVAIDSMFGAEIWISPFFNTQTTGPPVVDDFNGDGFVDVAIAGVTGNIHIGYNKIDSMEWITVNSGIPINSPLASADLDEDGDSELLCGSDRGMVLIIDGVTQKITGTIDINEQLNKAFGTFYEDNQIRYPVGVADFNGDNRPDLVVSCIQGRIIAIDGATKQRLWHDVLTNEITLNADYPVPFALGNFDDDGLTDIVISSEQSGIRTYSGKGDEKQPKIIWQLEREKSSLVHQSIVVSDINKDQFSDIIYLDTSGRLRILNGRNGENLSSEQPMPNKSSMPFVADLQNDGILDIFLIAKNGLVFQYKSNSRMPKGSVLWGQRYGHSQNTLTQSYELPQTTKANISMVLGILIFFGGGATTFLMQRKKRN